MMTTATLMKRYQILRTFCIVDVSNLMHRARWAIDGNADVDDYVGSSLDICFRSMRKVFDKFGADHIVACFDHFSWRKVVFETYKANRNERKESEDGAEVFKAIVDALEELRVFLDTKTNVTVLHQELCEGDDLVARWVQLHPDDRHVVISTDSDFKQLLSNNVEIYNGVNNTLFTIDGVFFQDGMKAKKDQRTREIYDETWKIKALASEDEYVVDPTWCLFEKIMLGDSGDNVPRAAPPGIGPKRLKGVAMDPLALDKLFSTLRTDQPDEPSVRTLFERNEMLVDLSKQPEEIIEILDASVNESSKKEPVPSAGVAFLQFCRKHNLIRILEDANKFSRMLTANYGVV